MKHFGEFVDTPRTVRFPPDAHWRHWRAPPLLVTWSQSHWSFYLSIYFLFYFFYNIISLVILPHSQQFVFQITQWFLKKDVKGG